MKNLAEEQEILRKLGNPQRTKQSECGKESKIIEVSAATTEKINSRLDALADQQYDATQYLASEIFSD